MLVRRAIIIPAYLVLTLLLTALSPIMLLISWLLARAPALRGAVPTFGLLLGYFWCETIGILAAAYLWLRHRNREAFLDANFRLQCWWANALKRLAEILFRLEFRINGEDALPGRGALMLPRHASIADTFIPMVFYAIPCQIRLRYVLKRELLFDPCLDIVGNRLPNLFVDRGGTDTERAIAGVTALVADIADNEGVLLYPEGTRFSAAKVAALRERWQGRPEQLGQLERWRHVLPPRTGGTLAALEANPGRDLIFCAHLGFEGASHFRHLANGSWSGARIEIEFWRVPFAEIPTDAEARREFLFQQWDRMDQWVSLRLKKD